MRKLRSACLLLVAGLSMSLVPAQDASESAPPVSKLAEGPISKFQPYIGNWEIDTKWANGQELWARNEYRVGLGGQFVEATTYAKDGDGKAYERYRTIFSYNAVKEEYVSYGFTFDGSATVVSNTLTESDGKVSISSQWKQDSAEIKQTVTTIDENSYRWQVWMRTGDDEEWNELMDGTWNRVDK